MLIRYENTMDDLLAFNHFHNAHSAPAKRIMAMSRWASSITIFGLLFALFNLLQGIQNLTLSLILAAVFAGVYAMMWPALVRRSVKKRTFKLYAAGSNKTFLCEHTVQITDGGIVTTTPYSETKLAWGGIERLETTPDYTFIYVGSMQAYIIPHSRLIEGDYRAFLTAFGQRFKPDAKLVHALPQ